MVRAAIFLAIVLAAASPPRAEALLCHPIFGCSCTVSATDISFGSFTPLSATPQNATGDVTIDCTGVIDVAPSVVVRLDDGQWGSFAARRLRTASSDQLDYNVYTTNQHSVVWGDDTGGSSSVAVSGGVLSLGHWTVSRPMHARATPVVTTKPGAYSDAIIVRIDW